MSLTSPAGQTQRLTATIVGMGMAVTVGTALGFEHLGGYIPCKLCLEERLPYYIGVPVMILAVAASMMRAPPIVTRGLMAVGGLLMVWSMVLGGYHAGVEWGWWAGPTDCGAVSPSAGGGSGGILDQIDRVVPPSCDKAAGRFLGISFAGWNFVTSVALAAIALGAAFTSRK